MHVQCTYDVCVTCEMQLDAWTPFLVHSMLSCAIGAVALKISLGEAEPWFSFKVLN
jgi:arginine/ornithine N-succinyltransferase beta subunit